VIRDFLLTFISGRPIPEANHAATINRAVYLSSEFPPSESTSIATLACSRTFENFWRMIQPSSAACAFPCAWWSHRENSSLKVTIPECRPRHGENVRDPSRVDAVPCAPPSAEMSAHHHLFLLREAPEISDIKFLDFTISYTAMLKHIYDGNTSC
jgi:hypothetical protein